VTGPGQNGKSLLGFVIPVCHLLFELGETVFVGIPDMRLADEKWRVDFLPTIEASFPDMLPTKGPGSKGGTIKDSVTFTNGARLKFMSAGQGDAGLAGPTTRNLVMTEVDKYDTAGETSREADPIRQMEARTNAFRDFGRRILMECTVSIPDGRIWQEIKGGTDSRLYHPCPHCGQWTSWEREHLVGWQDAPDVHAAGDAAAWKCPACEQIFREDERRKMHEKTLLVHRGQEVTADGEIVGAEPRTETFGLRWSAFDNPFVGTARLGKDEWLTKRASNKESAEKAARQFIWTIPYESADIELTPVNPEEIRERMSESKQGIVPDNAIAVTVGIDTGKYRLHWVAAAILPDNRGAVIDYGEQKTDSKTVGTIKGIQDALALLRSHFDSGWQSSDGRLHVPQQVWIDSGYHEHKQSVYNSCKATNTELGREFGDEIYRPTKGFAEGHKQMTRYYQPRELTTSVQYIGTEFDMRLQLDDQVYLVHVNADFWKARVQEGLSMDPQSDGAISLYLTPDQYHHQDYAQQIAAEKQVEEWHQDRGFLKVFKVVSRENHFLDATYLALAAGQFVREMNASDEYEDEDDTDPLVSLGSKYE
jgi:phage terminase large subunit GpA-like protein